MPLSINLVITLFAFAANSFFCRYALVEGAIDPGAFAFIRLSSAGLTLSIIMALKGKLKAVCTINKVNLWSAIMLFGYALSFSFAYVNLSTGTGALILFGTVQLTLVLFYVFSGYRLSLFEIIGMIIAFVGFVLLMLPSAEAPSLDVALLMVISGVCWAIFTLLGKRVTNPAIAITSGFILASLLFFLFGLLLVLLGMDWLVSFNNISWKGVSWALLSGVFASGFGYILWYQIVKKITVLQASVSQLAVPVIAFAMGSLFLNESITFVASVSSCLVLGGISLIFLVKKQ